ncbi:MAG TPA: BON domain-containing protein, partial [Bacteroidales bacterium]|nr:BON domain-containing protein [Bacteroidales bacterium]
LENNIEVTYDIVRRDAEIENDISQALKWSKLVDDALIEVEVEDGVVNLDGSVATVSDKNHAHFLALTSGVKRVNMEDLDIEWWVPNDELVRDKSEYASETDVENAIADAAFMDPRLESFDLMIDYEDGVVTLRGKVDNLEAKQAAKNIAMNTMAVKRVNNRIKVDTEFPPDDEKIRKNILEALARNSITESYEIVVSVSAGIVNLTGFVDSYLEKMTASAVAGKVDGITTVKNNLTVDEELSYYWWEGIPFYTWYYVPDINARVIAGSMIDDDQIKEDVKNELWWSPYVDSKDIQVEVDNGEVTLTGTASTLREYNRATQNAYEGGAWDVDNDILIK